MGKKLYDIISDIGKKSSNKSLPAKDNNKIDNSDKIDVTKFDNFQDDLILGANELEFRGKLVKVKYDDYYSSVIKASGTRLIEDRILAEYGSRTSFNEWCLKNRSDSVVVNNMLSFHDNPEYGMYFCDAGKDIDCYCLKTRRSKELQYITNSSEKYFLDIIVKHLRYKCDIKALRYLSQDNKIKKAINLEMTNHYRWMDKKPPMVSNSLNKFCRKYIPLDVEGEHGTWDAFMNQFNNQDKIKIENWLLNTFTEEPKNKKMLYLKGTGNTGKSTMVNALKDIIGVDLFAVLSYDIHDLARTGNLKNKMIVSIPDNKRYDIMYDQDLFNISGGDVSSFRSMYCNPSTDEQEAKIIITSNITPRFDFTKDYNNIRLDYCEVVNKIENKELKTDARMNLAKEFFAFIGDVYKRRRTQNKVE